MEKLSGASIYLIKCKLKDMALSTPGPSLRMNRVYRNMYGKQYLWMNSVLVITI